MRIACACGPRRPADDHWAARPGSLRSNARPAASCAQRRLDGRLRPARKLGTRTTYWRGERPATPEAKSYMSPISGDAEAKSYMSPLSPRSTSRREHLVDRAVGPEAEDVVGVPEGV